MLPNQATTVETSRTSHVVTSPISSHYHHHHPPLPPVRAATTAAVEPPGECPLLGQAGMSSSIPPAPNDTANAATSPSPNAANDPRHQCHVNGSRRHQQSCEPRKFPPPRPSSAMPHHRLPTTPTASRRNPTSPAPDKPNGATSPA